VETKIDSVTVAGLCSPFSTKLEDAGVDEAVGVEGVVEADEVSLLGGAVVEPVVLPEVVEPFEPEVVEVEFCPRL
jgi:hypothetical protein